MNLTIKNQVSGIRSYLGGIVTVADGGSTTIPRDLNVPIVTDAQFLFDITNLQVILNNGVKDLNPGESLELCEVLANFSTDPLATLFFYYSASVAIRQSGSANAGTTVWSMRNPLASPLNLVVERAEVSVSFDGTTPLSNNLLRYELIRFSAATPATGTVITPARHSNLAPASAADVRFLDTGLTVSGVSFESSAIDVFSCPAIRGTSVAYERRGLNIKLAPGEGLAIRVRDVDSMAGQGIVGKITWSLR